MAEAESEVLRFCNDVADVELVAVVEVEEADVTALEEEGKEVE